jgi:hypothetical protein
MPGLDPGIHAPVPHTRSYVGFPLLRRFMDRRVKPGDDGGVCCSGCANAPHPCLNGGFGRSRRRSVAGW